MMSNTSTWATAQLSEARALLTAAAAGNKILFAGGYGGTGLSKTVDIYDVNTNTWTTAQLSEARYIIGCSGVQEIRYSLQGAIVDKCFKDRGHL